VRRHVVSFTPSDLSDLFPDSDMDSDGLAPMRFLVFGSLDHHSSLLYFKKITSVVLFAAAFLYHLPLHYSKGISLSFRSKMFVERICFSLMLLTASSSAFTFVQPVSKGLGLTQSRASLKVCAHNENIGTEGSFDPLNLAKSEESKLSVSNKAVATAAFITVMAGFPVASNAAGPDWGIFEGRTGSLLHPITMGGLFAFQLSTALKGFKWRRQRELGDEISTLKKQMPKLPEGASSLQAAIDQGAAEGTDVRAYKAAISIENQVAELMAERKELSSQNNKDSHFQQGSLLAAVGTAFAIEGPLNTYARAGKLFPGPHLYAGAGLVVCWAIAAGCVPYMQKGNDTARSIHIGSNVLGMGLFAWQVTSGLPILFKVIEFTKWP
jgi:hypothetical protein